MLLKTYQQAGLEAYGQMGAVVKENPYHDEQGRFTSGPGGLIASLPVTRDPNLAVEARTTAAGIRTGPKFDELTSAQQRGVLLHEAAHYKGLDDWYLSGHADWNLAAKTEVGHLNGQTTPGEILAEVYSTLWTEPEFLRAHAPDLIPLVEEAARAVGLPLPVAKAAPAATLALRFDARTSGTKSWIERRAAALVKAITKEQREAIRLVVKRVYDSGMGIDDAIPLVRAALGENALFPRWAQAVVNYGMGLTDQGVAPAQVVEMTDAYYERLADQRAYMIARTEVLAAQNAGRMEGWTQLAQEGIIRVDEVLKEWDATYENPCPECDAYDGTQVGLFDEFELEGPPAHPNCRCVVQLVRA